MFVANKTRCDLANARPQSEQLHFMVISKCWCADSGEWGSALPTAYALLTLPCTSWTVRQVTDCRPSDSSVFATSEGRLCAVKHLLAPHANIESTACQREGGHQAELRSGIPKENHRRITG